MMVKRLTGRRRPCEIAPHCWATLLPPDQFSFPSGHSITAFAIAIPVGQLPTRLGELDPGKPTVVYCAGGYRSSVAASLLRRHGFTDVSDILGGFGAWDEAHQNA